MRVLPQDVLNRIYAKHSEVDVDVISHLCPNCRRIDVAVEEERACHIDQLEKLAEREEVCLVPPKKAEAPVAKGSAPEKAAPAEARKAAKDAADAPKTPAAPVAESPKAAPVPETARAPEAGTPAGQPAETPARQQAAAPETTPPVSDAAPAPEAAPSEPASPAEKPAD